MITLLALLLAQDAITGDRVKEHVGVLASDAMAGRETGSEEFIKAAEYVAGRFKKAGLKPAGDDGTYLAWWKYGDKKVPNVAGLIEGSGDEVLLIGAHLDGLGRRGDAIFNGADDNASGAAGVIVLAEAFASIKPKRSIVFVAFAGGENGQAGSQAWVEAPGRGKTIAMVNLDQIGRSKDRYLFVGGVGTSPVWRERVTRLGKKHGLDLETGAGGRAPTDSEVFYRKGVPVLNFFTNMHDDYHRPSDDAEKIDADAEAAILRMAYDVISETLQAEKPPGFRKDDSEAVPDDFYTRLAGGVPPPPRPKVRMGVGIEDAAGGVKLTSVQAGSPAERAGLKAGDVITKVDSARITGQNELLTALLKYKPGEKAKVTVLRDGKEREVEVEFASR